MSSLPHRSLVSVGSAADQKHARRNGRAAVETQNQLRASGRQEVDLASEAFALPGFRWPEDTSTYFVDAGKDPGLFLILGPVAYQGRAIVARTHHLPHV